MSHGAPLLYLLKSIVDDVIDIVISGSRDTLGTEPNETVAS